MYFYESPIWMFTIERHPDGFWLSLDGELTYATRHKPPPTTFMYILSALISGIGERERYPMFPRIFGSGRGDNSHFRHKVQSPDAVVCCENVCVGIFYLPMHKIQIILSKIAFPLGLAIQ